VDFRHRGCEEELSLAAEWRVGVAGGAPGVGDVAGAPGVAEALSVVRLERLPIAVGEDAVVAERQEERLDVDFVAQGI
jgi:hypothetical protein